MAFAKLSEDHDENSYSGSFGSLATKEIGSVVVFDIKQMKDSFIDFLATSELATFDELNMKVKKVDEVLQLFKAKYSADLSGSQAPAVQSQPAAAVTPPPQVPAPTPVMPTSVTPPPSSPTPSEPAPVPENGTAAQLVPATP